MGKGCCSLRADAGSMPWRFLSNTILPYYNMMIMISGWWFGAFFVFPYIEGIIIPFDYIIFFRGVDTTNQILVYSIHLPTCLFIALGWASHSAPGIQVPEGHPTAYAFSNHCCSRLILGIYMKRGVTSSKLNIAQWDLTARYFIWFHIGYVLNPCVHVQ